jgi:adenine nucleotide transporter 17
VTYPYIMAKVRIQARSADSEDAGLHYEPHTRHHDQQSKHPGAIRILARVWKNEGFVGWYRVRLLISYRALDKPCSLLVYIRE